MLDAMTSFSNSVGSSFGKNSKDVNVDDEQPTRESRRQNRRRKKDLTTAERARNRLKKHGLSDFGFGLEDTIDAVKMRST